MTALVIAAGVAVAGVVVLRTLDSMTLQYALSASVGAALLVRWPAARSGPAIARPWWSAPAAGLAAGALTTYEPVLTATLVVAVAIGLLTAIL